MAALLVIILFMQGRISAYAEEKTLPSGVSYEELGSRIEAFVREHEATNAGMSVSVFDREGTIYRNNFGYADKENLTAVDDETVFEWGSATKLLVWVSVMQLWEQGKIDLDCDIRNYLPDGFLTNLNYDMPITMINLMNHDAGFQESYTDIFIKEGVAVPALEEALRAHEPEQIYAPGTVTAYSNWGVAIAGYMVERISGVEFDEYVHHNIFEPLKMEHSALSVSLSDNEWVREQRKNLQCYTAEGELIPECFYNISLYPVGMCTSTIADFERFARALLKKDTALFRQTDTWETLFSPTDFFGDTDIPSNCHGFWMEPFAVKTVGHGGNTVGCSSYLLLWLEEGIGICVMTNQSREKVYNADMMELVFGKFQESDYFREPRKLPEGIYRDARVVRKGAFKCLSLSFGYGEWDPEEFWVYDSSDGMAKISYTYGDMTRVPMAVFLLEVGLFFLWIGSLGFSLVSLLVKMIRFLMNKVRHREGRKILLGRWSTLSCMFQLALSVLLAAAMTMMSGYELYRNYAWIFAVIGIIGIVMTGMMVYGFARNLKAPSGKGRKIYNILTVFFMAVTVVNILYWNLFMFWEV